VLEFKIKGLDDVKRRLKDIGKEIGRKVIDDACRGAARWFAAEARARCTSDEVRHDIKVIRLPGEDVPTQFTYLVSSGKTRVAHLLEFGTVPHAIGPNLKNRKAKNYVRHRMGNGEIITLQGPQAPGADGALTKTINRGGASISMSGRMAIRMGPDFRRSVWHKGAKAKPFMRPAFEEASEGSIRAFVRSAEAAFRRMERSGDLAPSWGGGF
jgi:hypothetical protein